MPNKAPQQRYLPTHDICYAYAVAMTFAQALEENLRAFLYTMDYHGLIEEIPLTAEQKKRYKDSDGFIDNSTCGLLIEKLRGTGTIKGRKAFKHLQHACEHRNRLAHSYLTEHDFAPDMSKAERDAIIQELHTIGMDLYAGFVISQAIREQAEHESDRRERVWAKFNEELGLPAHEDMKRKYLAARKRPK